MVESLYESEWDILKENLNLKKHRVSFIQAIEAFRDPDGIKLIDDRRSVFERRFYWIGKDLSGEIITGRFTVRANKIRIIGAGKWRKYRDYYEKAKQ